MTRVLLVRHGESTWNVEGRWQGHADAPLTELGERQAQAAADSLDFEITAVWSSDLSRARRTAEVLAAGAGVDQVRVDQRLRERDVGEWTGMTRGEIEEQWPGYLAEHKSPPGFEVDADVAERTLVAVRHLGATEAPDAVVLAVAHGGVIRTVERRLGVDPAPVPNLAGRWLTVSGDEVHAGKRQLLIDPDDVEVTVPPPR